MDYREIYSRILDIVDEGAYLTPTEYIDPEQRKAADHVMERLHDPSADPAEARQLAERYYRQHRIDQLTYLTALSVIASSPKIQDWTEAARLAAEQEQVALELGGPNLPDHLASVDRHRGCIAFLRGHHEVALDYFSRAFERQRTAENLGNVLCALIAVGDLDEARDLLTQVRSTFPRRIVLELDERILQDPDLALLSSEVSI